MKSKETNQPGSSSELENVKRELAKLQTEYYSDRKWLFRSFFFFLAAATIILAILFGTTTQEIGAKIKEAIGNTALRQATDSVQTLVARMTADALTSDSITQLLVTRAEFRITTGSTDPNNTPWKVYTPDALELELDLAKYEFSSTPIYLTTLKGESSHFATTGITSIYNPSKSGFTVYIKAVGPMKDMLAEARRAKWHVQWVALTASADTRQ